MLKAAGSGSEREVLFRLKAIPDKDNPRAFRGLAEEAKRSQKAIDDGVREGTRVRKREFDQHVKDHRKAIVEIEREEDRQHLRHRERQRSIAQQNRKARETEARENEKALKEIERERQRWLDREIREAKQAAREKERADKQAINERMRAERTAANERERIARQEAAQHQRSLAGMKQIMGSSIQLGRAFAMSGLIGEQSMQKMLDTLIKVQIATDLARGGINLYEGIGKTKWGGAAMSGARGLAGRMGGYAMGGAAMAGGAKAASALGATSIGGGALALGGSVLGGIGGVAAMGYSGYHFGQDMFGDGADPNSAYGRVANFYSGVGAQFHRATGLGPRPFWDLADSEDKTARMTQGRSNLQAGLAANEARGIERTAARRRQEAAIMERRDLDLRKRFRNDPERLNAERLDDARDITNTATNFLSKAGAINKHAIGVSGRVAESDIFGALQDEVAGNQRILELTKEQAAIRQQANERDKASIRETIAGYSEQLEIKKQEAKAINSGALSRLLRIDASDPMQQARGLAALEKLDRGEKLTREELPFIEQFGTAEEQRKGQENRAAQMQGPLADRVRKQQAADLEKNHRQQENLDEMIKQQSELYIELQGNFEKFIENGIDAVANLNTKIEQGMQKLKEMQEANQIANDGKETEVGVAMGGR